MTRTIIDIHPHIASPNTDRYPITPLAGKRSTWSAKQSVDLRQMIAAMDEAGVSKAAMVHSSTTYGFNADLVADAVAEEPDRLTGVFSVDVLAADAIEKIDYWRRRNLSGLRIFSRGTTMSEPWMRIDDPRIFPAYEHCGATGLSVVSNVHVANADQLEAVVRQFPGTKFIWDHLGSVECSGDRIDEAKPLLALSRYDNLYLKLTSVNLLDYTAEEAKPFFAKLVSEFGAGRIAWGSNYPATDGSLKQLVEKALNYLSFLPERDIDQIFSGTAISLYPVLGRG